MPLTRAPIGTLQNHLLKIWPLFWCKIITHKDLFDPESPVTDPTEDGLAPDDCIIDDYVAIAEFTSDTP